MMLKTVYGPPPADMERIEAAEPEGENCIREEEAAAPPAKVSLHRKGDGEGGADQC